LRRHRSIAEERATAMELVVDRGCCRHPHLRGVGGHAPHPPAAPLRRAPLGDGAGGTVIVKRRSALRRSLAGWHADRLRRCAGWATTSLAFRVRRVAARRG